VHVPHAETFRPRCEKSTHVPTTSPVYKHTSPVASSWHRREDAHTRPSPQSADALHPSFGAEGTTHASPATQVLEQTSPEQH
jgi:hypothetical protein